MRKTTGLRPKLAGKTGTPKVLKAKKTKKDSEAKKAAAPQIQALQEEAAPDEKPPSISSTNGHVDREQVEKAVTSLLKWIKKQQKQKAKAELFEDDLMLHVVVALKKIPSDTRTNGHRIPLPHSLYPVGGGREVCLIVKDDKKGEPGHKEAKERIEKEAGAGITKVIGVTKLRTKYGQHEAKRQLCGSYDLFLADDRVVCVLPKLLGKTFFKKKKHPIPVDLRGKSWSEKIRQACDSTYLYVGGGPCSVVRAARSDQSEEEIVENVMAVIEGIAGKVPKKWKNIQSLHLKTTDSLALPLFVAAPSMPSKIEA